jgi:hypothetical protein
LSGGDERKIQVKYSAISERYSFSMRTIKKSILFILACLYTLTGYCEVRDTVYAVVGENYKMKWLFREKVGMNDFVKIGDTLYLSAQESGIPNAVSDNGAKVDVIGLYMEKYFIFITPSGRRVGESRWSSEKFYGRYIEYYQSGKVKAEGSYDQYLYRTKTGKWTYYRKDGSVKKIKLY